MSSPPASGAPTAAATRPGPVSVLAELDFAAGQTPENLLLDPDGSVIMTFAYAGTVVRLHPDGTLAELARLPVTDGTATAPGGTTAGQVTGLARGPDGALLVATVTGLPHSHGVWRVPVDSTAPSLLGALPVDGFPNGLLRDGDAVLVADSRLATVWRVALADGAVTAALTHPALAPNSPTGLGANGLAWSDGTDTGETRTDPIDAPATLLVSVTDAGTIYRIPWAGGRAAGNPTAWARGVTAIDDLAVDPATGHAWAVGNATNLCWRIDSGGRVDQVLDADDGLRTPTAVAVSGGPRARLVITCAGYLPPHTPRVLTMPIPTTAAASAARFTPTEGGSMSPPVRTPPSADHTNTVSDDGQLPADLAAYRDSYTDLFGELPPLPAGKFAFTGQVAPDFLRRVEQLRAAAFDNPVFDTRTTQLLIFAMMVASGDGATRWHATAARRAGATWEQLQTITELATAVAALGPANQGGALLNQLHTDEAHSEGTRS